MDDRKQLRRADFITGILLILFGVFVVIVATTMPMKASYGGVETHWYVAPALFPLFIGGGIILLGSILIGIAVKQGGFVNLIEVFKKMFKNRFDERKIRTMVVFLALITFVYLFIPNIDFIISISIFLSFICIVFYSENRVVFKKITIFYIIECSILLLLFISTTARYLNNLYPYVMDILALLFLIVMYIYARNIMTRESVPRKKLRTVLAVAVITPLFLCPVFRYALLVPLPKEGLLINQMNQIFYMIKY